MNRETVVANSGAGALSQSDKHVRFEEQQDYHHQHQAP